MKIKSLTFVFFFVFSPMLFAQEEDVFALTPFSVEDSSVSGYVSSNSFSGSRLNVNPYNAFTAPIALRKSADSVTLSVTLRNSVRNAVDRNDQLMETVFSIIDAAEASDGIRAHNGNISLSTRNKKVSIFSSSNESSHVQLFILGDLKVGEDVYQKTVELKSFLEELNPVGETVLEEGNIGLSVKNPQGYRAEILELVLDDINNIKATLGGKVQMNINGLDGRVVVKQVNESEVDLLIPYSFSLNHTAKKEAS